MPGCGTVEETNTILLWVEHEAAVASSGSGETNGMNLKAV